MTLPFLQGEIMIQTITSPDNSLVKHIKKLQTKSYRTKTGEYLLEGYRLVHDAIENGVKLKNIIVADTFDASEFSHLDLTVMPEKLFNQLKTTVNSQGIMAVATMNERTFNENTVKDGNFFIYLDGIQDPGNLGTIVRIADAGGVDGVMLSKTCVDIYNPKTIRSTMASMFNVPVYENCETDTLKMLKNNGFDLVAGSLEAKCSHYEVDYSNHIVVVIGNEANGITDEVMSMCNVPVKIPIYGKAESLNASVACGILVYEILRQRGR